MRGAPSAYGLVFLVGVTACNRASPDPPIRTATVRAGPSATTTATTAPSSAVTRTETPADAGTSAALPLESVAPAAERAADARRDRAFATKLYMSVRGAPGDNLFFSPASVRIALSMAYAGARGATASEMERTLELSGNREEVARASGYAIRTWNAPERETPLSANAGDAERGAADRKKQTLRVVNRMWGQKGKTFLPEFLGVLARSYAAPLAQLDFEKDPEPARVAINQWVERSTEKKIRDLLAPGTIDRLTRVVLTNAVYFKATWANAFEGYLTKEGTFHGVSDVSVNMMQQTNDLPYAEVGDARVVELPYASGKMSMIVVLPNARDGLHKVEQAMNGKSLESWAKAVRRTSVHVTLPRFKTTTSLSLAEELSRMGMPLAFDAERADFSGVDGSKDLFISAVVHKGFIEVDEKGTEAAAATAVVMSYASARVDEPTPKEFRADHPFLFFLRDKALGHTLFMGKIADPSK
jgi:serpin B